MRPPITFRFALIALLLSSLIPLAVGLSVSAYLNSESTIVIMWRDLAHEMIEDAQGKTLRYLEPGGSQLELHRMMADDGALDLEDPKAILQTMRRCLLAQESITWCSWAGKNQSYYSAYRKEDGKLAFSQRDQIDGATRIINQDLNQAGEVESTTTSEGKFLPSSRPWWELGKQAARPRWSDAFLFASHQSPGVVLSLRQENEAGEFQGIWLAEYELSHIAEFLHAMREQARSFGGPFSQALVSIISDQGVVLGHPDGLTQAGTKESPQLAFAGEHQDRILKAAYQTLQQHAQHESFTQLQFQVDEKEYLGVAMPFLAKNAPDWTTLVVVPADALLGSIRENNRIAALLAGLVALLSTFMGIVLADRFVRPLARIAEDLDAIGTLNIPEKFSQEKSLIREVDHMIAARDRMSYGLRSFSKYVPAALVRELMQDGREATLGGNEEELTIYFSDIAGFTSISEKLSPQELVDALAEYLGEMSRIIGEEQGTVDKYIGDAIMAFWGAPRPHPAHAASACRAALRSQARLVDLRKKMQDERGIDLHARIGLNTGKVLVGNIGSERRMNYTVMGDAVNVASRLEAQCKPYGVGILIGERTFEVAAESILARPLDKIAVKGKEQGIIVYELMAMREDATEAQLQFCEQFTEAFYLYLDGKFAQAEALLTQLEAGAGEDEALQLLLKRCKRNSIAPPAYWDGIVRLTKK